MLSNKFYLRNCFAVFFHLTFNKFHTRIIIVLFFLPMFSIIFGIVLALQHNCHHDQSPHCFLDCYHQSSPDIDLQVSASRDRFNITFITFRFCVVAVHSYKQRHYMRTIIVCYFCLQCWIYLLLSASQLMGKIDISSTIQSNMISGATWQSNLF